jgi:hypothetical protein
MAINALMLELLYCTFVRYTAGEALNNGSREGTNNSTNIGFAKDEHKSGGELKYESCSGRHVLKRYPHPYDDR